MKCENVILYVSGELTPADKQAFEAHLQMCPACQRELSFLRRMEEAFVPPAAPQRAVEKLFAKTTRRSAWLLSGWKAVLAGVAACGLIVLWGVPHDPSVEAKQEVRAYLSENLDSDYQNFVTDLALFEQEF